MEALLNYFKPDQMDVDIERIRRELNVSRSTLAEWAQVSVDMIGKVERGERQLGENSIQSLRQMIAFAKASPNEKQILLEADRIIDRYTL